MPQPDYRALRGACLDTASMPNAGTDALWDALRPLPVYDMSEPGKLHADLTPEMLRAVQRSFERCKEWGVAIPFDWMHDGKGASYGVASEASIGEDGKWRVKPELNDLGRTTVTAQAGSLFLSPQFGTGPLCHPETGEVVEPIWVERIALTPTPRQNSLSPIQLSRLVDTPVALARFNDSDEVHTFRRQLEEACMGALSARDGWVRHWDGDDTTGRVVISAYGHDESQGSKLWMLDWARADDGTVTVSNPRYAEEKTIYSETVDSASAAPLSRTTEAHMRKFNASVYLGALIAGTGVQLSREELVFDVDDATADAFDALATQIKADREALATAGIELSRAQTELSQAKALAGDRDELSGKVVSLSREVEDLKAINAEREAAAVKAQAENYAAQLSRIDGFVPDTDAERARIVADCEKHGLDAVKSMHQGLIGSGAMVKGRFKPVALDRPAAGIDGSPMPMPNENAPVDIDAQIKAMQVETPTLSRAACLEQMLNTHIKEGAR